MVALCARRTVPTMAQFKGYHYSLIALGPLDHWGNSAYANHQGSRKCCDLTKLLLVDIVVDTGFDMGIYGNDLLRYFEQSLPEADFEAVNSIVISQVVEFDPIDQLLLVYAHG